MLCGRWLDWPVPPSPSDASLLLIHLLKVYDEFTISPRLRRRFAETNTALYSDFASTSFPVGPTYAGINVRTPRLGFTRRACTVGIVPPARTVAACSAVRTAGFTMIWLIPFAPRLPEYPTSNR